MDASVKITMPAVVIRETGKAGDWNELVMAELPRPSPAPGEALIQVEACSVNRADLLQRRGLYPPPPGASPVLGLDFAGFVIETGAGVEGLHTGDRVFGILSGGGYGRYVSVWAGHLVPIPANLGFVEAAAAGEVFFTAFLNIFMEAGIKPGEVLLVHGGGSGVGTASIQLAKANGVETIITAGSREKIDRCLALGASYAINYKEEEFASRVLEITGGKRVDVILDWIGAAYLGKHIEILKSRGRLILMGLMGGSEASIQLAPILTKRLRIIGSVLRSRSVEEKAAITHAFRQHVIPLLELGTVRPVVDRIYPVEAAEEAHRYMLEGCHFGKIVLTWRQIER